MYANSSAYITKSKAAADLKGLTKTASDNPKSSFATATKIWNKPPLKTATQQSARPKNADIKSARGLTLTQTPTTTAKAAAAARTTDNKNAIAATKAKTPYALTPATVRSPTGRSVALETKRNFVRDNVRSVVAGSTTPNSQAKTQKRIWNRYQPKVIDSGMNNNITKAMSNTENEKDGVTTRTALLTDSCIQTNEAEILNHDLLIGDIKFLLPSMELVKNIERNRNEKHVKQLLKSERKFEPHAMHESQRLSDLKEFLERAAITKKPRQRRAIESLENDRKIIASMDEMLARALPKTESMTNIQQRIKRKEDELLSLFDALDKFKV